MCSESLCRLKDVTVTTWFEAHNSTYDGAARAVARRHSVLPVGVARVEGTFQEGDVIEIHDHQGETIASGVVNFDDRELRAIIGLRSDEIEAKTDTTPNRVFDNDRVKRFYTSVQYSALCASRQYEVTTTDA
jgi:glutamate 5-kinase